MRRVMIIGGSGSGKSTLARRLGNALTLPVIHIDPMYWAPGWVQRKPEETMALALAAAEKDAWVFEGNHTSSMPARMARADTLIFLDVGTASRLSRVILRSIRYYGRTRPDMGTDCPERFDWKFFKFVAGYEKNGRIKALKTLKNAPPHLAIHHLKGKAAIERYAKNIETGHTA